MFSDHYFSIDRSFSSQIFFLALCLSAEQFQMALEGFGIVKTTDSLIQNKYYNSFSLLNHL